MGNTFTSGSVKLTATPATSAITLPGMARGDKVTAPITVTNTATLPLRYAVDSFTTEDVLAAKLELTTKSGVITCADAGFGTDGTAAYSACDLGSVASTKIFGDAAHGSQPGDRDLAAGASEVLCAQVVLPLTSATTSQGQTTTETFTFNAEHDVADPVLAGTLVGTTVPASWTPGAGGGTVYVGRLLQQQDPQGDSGGGGEHLGRQHVRVRRGHRRRHQIQRFPGSRGRPRRDHRVCERPEQQPDPQGDSRRG